MHMKDIKEALAKWSFARYPLVKVWLEWLVGENERIQSDLVKVETGNIRLWKENECLSKQIKDYERVLKWYANDQYYHILDQHGYKAVENDEGEQAREALKRWNVTNLKEEYHVECPDCLGTGKDRDAVNAASYPDNCLTCGGSGCVKEEDEEE